MTQAEYDPLSEELRARLQADARVLALVALGSTALTERRDAFSDHDFWVVLTPGCRAAFLDDLSWLPDPEKRVSAIRVGTRYLITLDLAAHVMEFGVFEPEELSEGKLDAYRMLFDRGGVADRLAEVASRSRPGRKAQESRAECEQLLIILLTGAARAMRGELLSSHKYLAYFAPDLILDLLVRGKSYPRPERIDRLDPWRRFEALDPVVAANLHAAVRLPPVEAALSLLGIAERELRSVVADFPVEAAAVTRLALQRLR